MFSLMLALSQIESDDDRAFLEQLYQAHAGDMFRMAIYLGAGRADAEDAVSDAFISLAGKIPYLRQLHCNVLRSYCISTVKNALLMIYRKRGARREDPADGLLDDAPAEDEGQPEGELIRRAEQEALLRAMRQLSQSDQEVLRMRYFDRLAFGQIAEILGLQPGSARSRCLRAKLRLAMLLKGEEQ